MKTTTTTTDQQTRQARIEQELTRLEPAIARLEELLLGGTRWRDAAETVGVSWGEISKYGKIINDRLKRASEIGTEWRRALRHERDHQRAMAGNEKVLFKLIDRDRAKCALAGDAQARDEREVR